MVGLAWVPLQAGSMSWVPQNVPMTSHNPEIAPCIWIIVGPTVIQAIGIEVLGPETQKQSKPIGSVCMVYILTKLGYIDGKCGSI